jgi:hypothetical protein
LSACNDLRPGDLFGGHVRACNVFPSDHVRSKNLSASANENVSARHDVRPGDLCPGDLRSGCVRPGDMCPGDMCSGCVRPGGMCASGACDVCPGDL